MLETSATTWSIPVKLHEIMGLVLLDKCFKCLNIDMLQNSTVPIIPSPLEWLGEQLAL